MGNLELQIYEDAWLNMTHCLELRRHICKCGCAAYLESFEVYLFGATLGLVKVQVLACVASCVTSDNRERLSWEAIHPTGSKPLELQHVTTV
jgi:hypothetical protein